MACFCILGGTSWYRSCGLWSPLLTAWSSGCSFPNLTVPPHRYTPASCSHWDFCSCSALFFLPLLLSHLTHKRHKSRRGCVFTARQLLQHQGWVQGSCWKTCYTHTSTHTCFHTCLWLMEDKHSAKAVCVFLPGVPWHVCHRWGGSPSLTTWHPRLNRASHLLIDLPGVLSSVWDVGSCHWGCPTSLLTRPLCSFTTLEEICEGTRTREDQVKATKLGQHSHITLEVALAEHKDAGWSSCEQRQQTSMLQCHNL